jgi:hypothetical protein
MQNDMYDHQGQNEEADQINNEIQCSAFNHIQLMLGCKIQTSFEIS